MGNPKGSNAGAHGIKGVSGRKSAFVEMQCAKIVQRAFLKGINLEKLKKLGEKKKIKLIEYTLARALKSDRILSELLRKVIPDKIEHSGNSEAPVELTITDKKQYDEIKKAIINADRVSRGNGK